MTGAAFYGGGINRPLLKVLTTLNLGNRRVLSVGCGSAALEAVLQEHYYSYVVGLDYSKEAITVAKTRIKNAFVFDLEKGSLKEILGKKRFDIILFADILEHVRCPSVLLEEVKDFLKDTGVIVVSIPNIANWSIRLNLLGGRWDYTDVGLLDKTHIKFYTLKTAKKLITRRGYKIMSVDYSTSIVNILYGKLKSIPYEKEVYPVESKLVIPKKKGILRRAARFFIERCDRMVTYLMPGLCAYQFIIVAKK